MKRKDEMQKDIYLFSPLVNHKGGKTHLKLHPWGVVGFQDKEKTNKLQSLQ